MNFNYNELLEKVNKDIERNGFKITTPYIEESDDFDVWIIEEGNEPICFADSLQEDEVANCVNDAWAHVRAIIER